MAELKESFWKAHRVHLGANCCYCEHGYLEVGLIHIKDKPRKNTRGTTSGAELGVEKVRLTQERTAPLEAGLREPSSHPPLPWWEEPLSF